MNYRHAYHAGNPADVLKHAILAWILSYFNKKTAPYAYIDSHAGLGAYDLKGEQALRTGEWVEGIGRLYDADLPPAMREALAPYISTVKAMNPNGGLRYYPGSPSLAQELCRDEDRILLCEKHPQDVETLKTNMQGDKRVKVLHHDGWIAPRSLLPPKERRGLLLIDPPFEEIDDFERCVTAVNDALARFATGTIMIWYPVKEGVDIKGFQRALESHNPDKWLNLTLMLRPLSSKGLPGSGVFIVNPPFGLKQSYSATAPFWAKVLQAPEARLTFEGREG